MLEFVNRLNELKKLRSFSGKLAVLFGRRRVGKTTLVEQWLKERRHSYTQAIEGSEYEQLEQLVADLAPVLPQGIFPKSWSEFLAALKLIREECVIVIDEFPYLVRSKPSLPSILQRWIDHDQPKTIQLALLGSSQSMMHDAFMQSKAPLYERADLLLRVEPMSYKHFCDACSYDPLKIESFLIFSLVGGVPRYWRYAAQLGSILNVADQMFFAKGSYLEDEPDRLLKDENITGQQAKAIFEAIGRGSSRASEIAARMQIPQTGLSKPMTVLIQSNLVIRTVPFGENSRNSKRTLYRIGDYALRFWYQVYSIHRSRWHHYDEDQKLSLIRIHADSVLEDEFRKMYPEAARYWSGSRAEFDCVRFAPKDTRKVIVSELKIGRLKVAEKAKIAADVESKFLTAPLANTYKLAGVEVLDGGDALRKLVEQG